MGKLYQSPDFQHVLPHQHCESSHYESYHHDCFHYDRLSLIVTIVIVATVIVAIMIDATITFQWHHIGFGILSVVIEDTFNNVQGTELNDIYQ